LRSSLLALGAIVLAACSQSSIAPSGTSASATPLASACVDDQRDAWHRFGCDSGEPCEKLRAGESLGDLDGDGVPDRLWAAESLCGATGNCEYKVYLTSKGCMRFAGSVGGVALQVLGGAHHGVRDLSSYWKGGCVGMEGAYEEHAFDGQEFRVTRTVSCECPKGWPDSPKTDPKRDPACPSTQ
jgi:hypothetical protein